MSKYTFEGGQVTPRQLKKLGLVYSVASITAALEAGCETMPELLAHIEGSNAEARRRTGALGAEALGRPKFGRTQG